MPEVSIEQPLLPISLTITYAFEHMCLLLHLHAYVIFGATLFSGEETLIRL